MTTNHNNRPIKRINREVEYILKNMPDYHVEILSKSYNDDDIIKDKDNNNNNNNNNIYVQVITPNFNVLLFTITNDYPFKPPLNVKLNDTNYRHLLSNMPARINYLYYHPNDVYYKENFEIVNYSKPDCLCCSTIMCYSNWSPACTIATILHQIKQHNLLKRQLSYKLSLKFIFDKKNLPLELIRNVFQYL